MRWIREGWLWLRSLIRPEELDCGLEEEVRFHIDCQVEKNLRAGMPPDEARRRAYTQFGEVEHVKRRRRAEFPLALGQDSLLDLRHAVRALRRAPVVALRPPYPIEPTNP